MEDVAHDLTDGLITKVTERIKSVYAAAAESVERQLTDALKEYERAREAKRRETYAQMANSANWDERKRLEAEFRAWREQELNKATARGSLLEKLAYELADADELARAAVRGELAEAFSANADWATFQVERELGKVCTSWTLYDQDTVARLLVEDPDLYPQPSLDVQKAIRWNVGHLQAVVTQAALSGDAIPEIGKRLRRVIKMNEAGAEMVARTAMTAAENAGRVQSYERAAGMGIEIEQTWVATLDERTRQEHRALDGEAVAIGGRFSNGLRYPGDPQGAYASICNCRCTLIAQMKGNALDMARDSRWKKLDPGTTYEQWKGLKTNG